MELNQLNKEIHEAQQENKRLHEEVVVVLKEEACIREKLKRYFSVIIVCRIVVT